MLKKFLIGTFVALSVMAFTFASAADFGTTTLRVGSKGEAVKAVQTLVGATADGSFGPMTKAKVQVWQAANGLTADGVFGAMSKAKANATTTTTTSTVAGCTAGALFSSTTGAACTTTTTLPAGCTAGAAFSSTTGAACVAGTVVTGTLTGGAGDLIATTTSVDVETDVTEGSKDIKVMGFKAEADGSDVSLTNLKVTLVNANTDGGTASSTRLERYISDVSVWMGSTKVGTALASDFSKDGSTYTKNIALSGATVLEGSAAKKTFYITFTALSNIDTTDLANDSWSLALSDIRFVDGSGAIMTDTYTQTINSNSKNATINFMSLATSGDVKITVSKASTSPVARNVSVSDSASTSDITMLEFKIKAAGSPITLDEMDFTLTSVGATPTEIASELALYRGTERLGELTTLGASASTDNSLTLDEDLTIPAGETYTFKVVAKVNTIVVGSFGQGDSLKVDLSATPFAGVHEDSNGDTVTNIVGTALGEVQAFYSVGISVANFTQSHSEITESGAVVKGVYTVGFDVTAFGNTYYIPKILENSALDSNDTSGLSYSLYGDTGAATIAEAATTVTSSASALASSNASTVSSYFEIPEGETRHFSATINVIPGTGTRSPTSDFVSVQLGEILYDLNTTAVGDDESIYTIAPAANYKTTGYSL